MSLSPWEWFVVRTVVHEPRSSYPMLRRLFEHDVGPESVVSFSPDELSVLSQEIHRLRGSLAASHDGEVLGHNLSATVTVASVREFLMRIDAVLQEGIANKATLIAEGD